MIKKKPTHSWAPPMPEKSHSVIYRCGSENCTFEEIPPNLSDTETERKVLKQLKTWNNGIWEYLAVVSTVCIEMSFNDATGKAQL